MSFKNYLKQFFKLSIPAILGQIGAVLMGITDMVMLGNVSKTELAAVGVANQIYFMFLVFGLGIMAALAPLVAATKGANKNTDCGELLRAGIEISFIVSIVLSMILYVFCENFHIFNQPYEIEVIAKRYLKMLTISTIPYLLFIAIKQYSDGLHLTKSSMYITLAGIIVNGLLNYVFIYGLFSLPPSGALGAGIATLFTRILMALSFVVYVFKNDVYKKFLPNLISTFNTMPVIMKVLKTGIPSGFQMLFEVTTFSVITIMVGWIGTEYLAAHQILIGLVAIVYTISAGFSIAGSINVATALGKKDKLAIIRWSKFTIIIISISTAVLTVSLAWFREPIVSLFIHEHEVICIVFETFKIMCLLLMIDVFQTTSIGLLRSLEDVKSSSYVTLLAYFLLGTLLSYYLTFIYDMKLYGIWIGISIGGLLSNVILWIRYFYLLSSLKNKIL
ncbi:MAG: MATE family efflux transporter [Cytophagaceae bacterium]|nr:MATE family efflux transporter [Cytophagaceae bacterium]MDW8455732.1 MATE family efflux transporter [Cytophagaceae bacterium]